MTVNTIPASAIVNVIPGVIGAGGAQLTLTGLVLTQSTRPPIGTIQTFPTAAAVATYFGAASTEANLATVYFNGYTNSTAKPGAMLFAQYPPAAVPAYLRGGAGVTLAQVQAVTSGSLTITIEGQAHTTASINLSAATSLSNAATLLNSATAYADASTTLTAISGTTLTISGTTTGLIYPGQVITGTGVTAGTTIVSGSGNSWVVSVSQTVASTTIVYGTALWTYDSVSGAFVLTGGAPGAVGTITYASGTLATALNLTAVTGAVISQGSAAATESAFMTAVVGQTSNFATFMTTWEPTTASKINFANWSNGQNDRFIYVFYTADITLTQSPPATTSAEYALTQSNAQGWMSCYAPVNTSVAAAFICGTIASINFGALNGRQDLAFSSQTGITADVTNQTIAANLIANGSNFYGIYGTAAQNFSFLYPGQCGGPFAWADSYVNQIWLNAALQSAVLALLTQIGSVPYNSAGYALIAAACADPINAALNFGAIRAGVTLSAAQIAEVNTAAGFNIASVIQTRGWYLLIQPASASARAARQSPPITLFYTDGQSIQSVTLASLEVA